MNILELELSPLILNLPKQTHSRNTGNIKKLLRQSNLIAKCNIGLLYVGLFLRFDTCIQIETITDVQAELRAVIINVAEIIRR